MILWLGWWRALWDFCMRDSGIMGILWRRLLILLVIGRGLLGVLLRRVRCVLSGINDMTLYLPHIGFCGFLPRTYLSLVLYLLSPFLCVFCENFECLWSLWTFLTSGLHPDHRDHSPSANLGNPNRTPRDHRYSIYP